LFNVLLARVALVDATISNTEDMNTQYKKELETESESMKSNLKEESDSVDFLNMQKE